MKLGALGLVCAPVSLGRSGTRNRRPSRLLINSVRCCHSLDGKAPFTRS